MIGKPAKAHDLKIMHLEGESLLRLQRLSVKRRSVQVYLAQDNQRVAINTDKSRCY